MSNYVEASGKHSKSLFYKDSGDSIPNCENQQNKYYIARVSCFYYHFK